MNKFLAILLPILFVTTVTANAGGRIQNEDVKSLTDITAAVLTTTGNISSSTTPTCITSPGSTTGLAVGLFIYDTTNPTAIASGTTIAGLPGTCSAGQIQMSASAVSTHTGDTLTFGGQASQLINDTKLWVTSVTPPQQLSKAITTGAIGGTAGTKNYLTTYNGNSGNGNFEFGNTTGWSLGTIGTLTNGLPTGSPTFGSGASGNLSISTVTSGSQIAGTYSLSYASSAATTAGNMLASSAFTIDTEDQAKVMTVKFYYTANSGTANDNWSGTSSNSFAWAAYDVTNSAWLSSTGNFCATQSSGVGYCTGTLQTGSSTASMRFVFYNANASSGATTIYLDDFFVGPQTAPFGPSMTDWVQYTPTITGFGTATSITAYSRRVGDSLQIKGVFNSGTPTATTAAISLGYNGVNGNVSTDATKTLGEVVGSLWISASNSTYFSWSILANGGTSNVNIGFQSSASSALTAAAGSGIGATGSTQLQFFAQVPITGWSSNTAMSADTDTRVAAMSVYATPTGTPGSSATIVNYGAATLDTHGAWNGTTTYTVPVSGVYEVSATVGVTGTAAVSKDCQLELHKNTNAFAITSPESDASSSRCNQSVTGLVSAVAGDTLAVYFSTSFASPVFQAGIGNISIKRLSGPAVVAATESVSARYTFVGNTALPTNTLENLSSTYATYTKLRDTHGAFNTSTGVYTVPVSGMYRISLRSGIVGVTANTGVMQNAVQQAGSASTASFVNASITNTPSNATESQLSDTFPAQAGDTFTLQALQNNGSSIALVATAGVNSFSIERIGN